MSISKPFQIVILGCGAIAQAVYIPILKNMKDRFQVRACVDLSIDNARIVAAALGGDAVEGLEVLNDLPSTDGAIVALPNRLHAEATIRCLETGRHTLCEKPLALAARECDDIGAALAKSGLELCVNLQRRLYPSMQMVKWLLNAGWLGELHEIEVWEGGLGGWQSRTGFQFNPAASGGGVTVDRGSHVYDLLVHWLGRPNLVSYRDDAAGGCEANSFAEFLWPGSLVAKVHITKSEPWESVVKIHGAKGTVVFDGGVPGELRFEAFSGNQAGLPERAVMRVGPEHFSFMDAISSLMDGWRIAATTAGPNPTPFTEVSQSIGLIEECYQRRETWSPDWLKWTGD